MRGLLFLLAITFNLVNSQSIKDLDALRQVQIDNDYFVLDADAQNYLNKITSPTEQDKLDVNSLVLALKSNNVWNQLDAIYLFLGTTAADHKWNLKDPRDLDEAYRLKFYGGLTHNNREVVGNGSDGYADTFLNPSNLYTVNNQSLTLKLTTDNAAVTPQPVEIGATETGTSPLGINMEKASGIFLTPAFIIAMNDLNSPYSNGSVVIPREGVYTGFRTSSSIRAYKNGSYENQWAGTGLLPNSNFYLFNASVSNNPSVFGASTQGMSFVAIGKGLNASDINVFHDAVSDW